MQLKNYTVVFCSGSTRRNFFMQMRDGLCNK